MSESIVVYAVSDLTGQTVERIVRAASAQFASGRVAIKVVQHATSASEVIQLISNQGDELRSCAVFHTILDRHTREDLRNALQTLRIPSVDLLGSTAHVMAELLGEQPQLTPGLTIEDGAEPQYFDLRKR